MSDEGGLDVFALALKLTTSGAEQMESSITAIETEGTAATAVLEGMAIAAGVLVAAFVILEKASEFLKGSVEAAGEEEQVYVRMGTAVANAGVNFAEARPAIDALLESLSDKSTFRVDDLGKAFTRLVQLTGNVGGSMHMLGVVADFAAGRNIDLESAANLVGKAMNGNATMLNRMLGLHGDAAQAIAVLTERYQGNAAALKDTMGGAQVEAAKQMHELMEEIGGVIAHEGGLKDATFSWAGLLKEATGWIHEHRGALGELVRDFIAFVSFVGSQALTILRGLVNTWEALHLGLLVAITTVKDIGPAFKLMIADVVLGYTAWLEASANMVPGLHSVLDGITSKMRAFGTEMSNNATLALAKNRQELDAFTESLKAHADTTEKTTPAVKDLGNAHKQTTEDLFKEAEALEKLAELRALSGPEFQKLEGDYTKLSALVDTHTLSLENQAKAEELLQKMQKAAPILTGPQITFEPMVAGRTKQTVEQGLQIYQNEITEGLKKSEAQDKAALKHKSQMFAASAEGEFFLANQQIKQAIDQKVRNDFLSLGSDLAGVISDTIGGAFAGGLSNAGQIAKKGLGQIMSAMGKDMLLASGPLKALAQAMKNPFTSGWAIAAAGLVLMALGAQLGADAASGGGGGDSGGGYGGNITGAGAGTGAQTMTTITLPNTGASTAGKLRPLPPINVGPVIGPNDGKAQRDLIELIRGGLRRGLSLT